MAAVHPRIHPARAGRRSGFYGLSSIVLALLLLSIPCAGAVADVQARDAAIASTTVVVFSDRSMNQEQWTDLFGALRTGLADGGAETQALGGDAEFVRGDSVVAGFRVKTAIVVYLHGECDLAPLVKRTAFGVPLGWVLRRHGRIEPFAHVDCTRIGQVLGPQAMGLNTDERNAVMAGAIARVILHEWIHIATQNCQHAERGISKAQFGVADLMAGDGLPVARTRNSGR